jgi:hypothetical protein
MRLSWPPSRGCDFGQQYVATIADFASEVAGVVGDKGKIAYDTSLRDRPPQKLLDISKIKNLGWLPKIRRMTDWPLPMPIFWPAATA